MSLAWPAREGLAGVDEAGRGPLAGPVVAAAVILPARPSAALAGLDDSKKLSAAARERLAVAIRAEAVAWALGWADAGEIDAINILQATLLAMRRALLALPMRPAGVRVDGNRLPQRDGLGIDGEFIAIVGGDGREAAIAAASILAKTGRDAYMAEVDLAHPGYGFAVHKGYGTARHLAALADLGPCPLHRRSFEPVRSASGRAAQTE
jgi:ribonuclease HII